MSDPEVSRATASDRARVVDTVVAAFEADPAFRFFFSDESTFHQQAVMFAGYLFDRRVGQNAVWIVDGGSSVAMWENPTEAAPPDPELRLPADTLARLEEYDKAVHPLLPRTPFSYLGILATHPDSAGRRWGRAVMRAGLAQSEAAGLPAYLETATPHNVEMYRRAGWEVTDYATLGALEVWVMKANSHPVGRLDSE